MLKVEFAKILEPQLPRLNLLAELDADIAMKQWRSTFDTYILEDEDETDSRSFSKSESGSEASCDSDFCSTTFFFRPVNSHFSVNHTVVVKALLGVTWAMALVSIYIQPQITPNLWRESNCCHAGRYAEINENIGIQSSLLMMKLDTAQ
jgi:hypothetical protein